MQGYSRFLKAINVLGDLLLLNACFFIAYYIKWPDYSFLWYKDYHLLLLVFNVIWLLSAYVLKFYNIYRVTKVSSIVSGAVRMILLHILGITAFIVVTKSYNFSRFHLLVSYSSFFVLVIFWKVFFTELVRYYRKTGYNFRRIIIAGAGEIGQELTKIIEEHSEYGYRILGFFDDKSSDKPLLGNLSDIENYVANNRVDEIYCSLPDTPPEKVAKLIKLADNNLIRIKFLPDFRGLQHKAVEVDFYDYMPVLVFRKEPLDDIVNKFIKRAFDITFSLLVILCLMSWLFPLIALLVKLSSPGPVFFKQKRSGENNRTFWCWKFRTMRVNKSSDEQQASKNDARITPIGRFLRKTNMDELPQFFNVLIGNMSVVGPRPHMLAHTEQYSNIIDKYMVRHFVKPGITGLAQIKGYRGETKDPRLMENRVRVDIFYIENWSFILDIKIILLTILNMLKGEKNAY